MTKTDIVNQISENVNGITKADINTVLDEFKNVVFDAMEMKENVNWVGFMKIERIPVKERKGRNPRTGKDMIIPAHDVVRIHASQPLQNFVK